MIYNTVIKIIKNNKIKLESPLASLGPPLALPLGFALPSRPVPKVVKRHQSGEALLLLAPLGPP